MRYLNTPSWKCAVMAMCGEQFSRGYATNEVEQVRALEEGEVTGTSVTFMPDFQIMQENVFSFDMLETRFRQMAYLVKGIMICLVDERIDPLPRELSFYFEGGVPSFVRYLNRNRDELHKVVGGGGEFKFKYVLEGKELDGLMMIHFAVQYTDSTNTLEMAFANTINTADGGTHLTGCVLRSPVCSTTTHAKRASSRTKT